MNPDFLSSWMMSLEDQSEHILTCKLQVIIRTTHLQSHLKCDWRLQKVSTSCEHMGFVFMGVCHRQSGQVLPVTCSDWGFQVKEWLLFSQNHFLWYTYQHHRVLLSDYFLVSHSSLLSTLPSKVTPPKVEWVNFTHGTNVLHQSVNLHCCKSNTSNPFNLILSILTVTRYICPHDLLTHFSFSLSLSLQGWGTWRNQMWATHGNEQIVS